MTNRAEIAAKDITDQIAKHRWASPSVTRTESLAFYEAIAAYCTERRMTKKYRISKIVLAVAKERGNDPNYKSDVEFVLGMCSTAEAEARTADWVIDNSLYSLPRLLRCYPTGRDVVARALIAAAKRLNVPLEDAP